MSWYNTQGPLWDHVLFSRVRYIRNIAKQSFAPSGDLKKSAEAIAKLESILGKNGFRAERPAPGVTAEMLSLAEKQLIGRDLVYSDKPRAIFLNEPCNLLVYVGGNNHITVSSVVSGAGVGEARRMAMGAEELIDRELSFAYADGIGYLSPYPQDCGSGIEFSAALYLPSLRLSGKAAGGAGIACDPALTLRPMMSGADNAGDLYILSYVPHYLADEESACDFFLNTVTAMAEKEKSRLRILCKDIEKDIYETARRSLGALIYATRLGEGEMLRMISSIRLALSVSEGGCEDLPDITTLNYLSAEGLSASVTLSASEKCLTSEDCERARAALVCRYIEHKNEVKNVK